MTDYLLCIFCKQPVGSDFVADSNGEAACKPCGEAELKAQRRERRENSALRKRFGVIIQGTDASGAIRMGQHNSTMLELKKLGFYTLDKETIRGTGLGYRPTWRITPAGRQALIAQPAAPSPSHPVTGE